MPSEEPAEDLRLGGAQLRELRGDVRNRAMVLAQLVTHGRAVDRRGVTVGSEGGGEGLRPLGRGVGSLDGRPVALLELSCTPARELGHRVGPACFGEEAQGAHREVVVRLGESVAAGVGESEVLGRSTAPPDGDRRPGRLGRRQTS